MPDRDRRNMGPVRATTNPTEARSQPPLRAMPWNRLGRAGTSRRSRRAAGTSRRVWPLGLALLGPMSLMLFAGVMLLGVAQERLKGVRFRPIVAQNEPVGTDAFPTANVTTGPVLKRTPIAENNETGTRAPSAIVLVAAEEGENDSVDEASGSGIVTAEGTEDRADVSASPYRQVAGEDDGWFSKWPWSGKKDSKTTGKSASSVAKGKAATKGNPPAEIADGRGGAKKSGWGWWPGKSATEPYQHQRPRDTKKEPAQAKIINPNSPSPAAALAAKRAEDKSTRIADAGRGRASIGTKTTAPSDTSDEPGNAASEAFGPRVVQGGGPVKTASKPKSTKTATEKPAEEGADAIGEVVTKPRVSRPLADEEGQQPPEIVRRTPSETRTAALVPNTPSAPPKDEVIRKVSAAPRAVGFDRPEMAPLLDRREAIIRAIAAARESGDVEEEFDVAFRLREVERNILKESSKWPAEEQDDLGQFRDQHIALLKWLADHYEPDDYASCERLWKEIAFHVGKLDRGDDWMTATTQRELARVSRLSQASPEELRKWRAGIDAERESITLRDEGNYTAALEAARKAYVYRAELLGEDAPRKATGLNNIAVLLDLTGRLDEADRQYDAAAKLLEKSVGPEHPESIRTALNRADLWIRQYRLAEAEELLAAIGPRVRKSLGEQHPEYARQLYQMSRIATERGRYGEAAELARRSVSVLGAAEGASAADEAVARHQLSTALRLLGEFEEAEEVAEEAVRRVDETTPETDLARAAARFNLGAIQLKLAKFEATERSISEAMAITDAPRNRNSPTQAKLLALRAELRQDQGDYKAAVILLRESIDLLAKTTGTDHPDYAIVLNQLAIVHIEQTEYVEAGSLLAEARRIQKSTTGDKHPSAVATITNAARLQQRRQSRRTAQQFIQQAAGMALQAYGEEHPEFARELATLGAISRDLQQYGAAQTLLEQALPVLERTLSTAHPEYGRAATQLGRVYGALGQADRGEALLKVAAEAADSAFGDKHPQYGVAIRELGAFYRDAKRWDDAEDKLLAAAGILNTRLGESHPEAIRALDELGLTYLAMNDPRRAHQALQTAAQRYAQTLGAAHPEAIAALEQLAQVYDLTHQPDQAKALRTRAEQLAREAMAVAADPKLDELARQMLPRSTN
jgi:hypothetical protein